MRTVVVVGTRPEAIKLAPLTKLLGHEATIVHTGQHFSAGMCGPITPDVILEAHDDRDISRGHQLGNLVVALDYFFRRHKPDAVLVQGDTTSALAGALAANATNTPLVHVEAGLRSFDRAMPEEHHRVLIDHLADLCCAPTPLARNNLVAEHIARERIEVTGNTIVEAVITALPSERDQARILHEFGLTHRGFVLATIHRPENADNPVNLAAILHQLATSPVPVVFPLHPRTRRSITTFELSTVAGKLRTTEPLEYPAQLSLIRHAVGLITDSGDIQEEATVLKRPILIIRQSNERPEVEHQFGNRGLPGDDATSQTVTTWVRDATTIDDRIANVPTPFGDGTASTRIVKALHSRFGDQQPKSSRVRSGPIELLQPVPSN